MFLLEKIIHFNKLINRDRRKMENSRRCGICYHNVPIASYAKHLRFKKQIGNIKKDDIFIPERLFKEAQETIKKK